MIFFVVLKKFFYSFIIFFNYYFYLLGACSLGLVLITVILIQCGLFVDFKTYFGISQNIERLTKDPMGQSNGIRTRVM